MKKRLDVLLTEQGLAPSREKAKALIMAGIVYVNNQKEDKAGTSFPEDAVVEVRGQGLRYVSRGGLKLEKAMQAFPIDLTGRYCMDIGASTGGFTDCMLQNGAAGVYAIDVGYGQLDWKLREDPRVICMEKTNFRYVKPEDLDPARMPDFASVDVSFISLSKILPPAHAILPAGGEMVCLIKPQFEAGREKVGKKGVMFCRSRREQALQFWAFPGLQFAVLREISNTLCTCGAWRMIPQPCLRQPRQIQKASCLSLLRNLRQPWQMQRAT